MKKKKTETPHVIWAHFRFAIVGPLLMSPPVKGELKKQLKKLSEQSWCHPITGQVAFFKFSTIERWYYQAKNSENPINNLRSKLRSDASMFRRITPDLQLMIRQQYQAHPSWSYQLHTDNLAVAIQEKFDGKEVPPSYSTINRYMKANGFYKRRSTPKPNTAGGHLAAQRLEQREVRSFEMDYVNSLWHLDFHHGSRKILDRSGVWRKPLLLCILDDRSRLVCHAQWYFTETTETLVHGFMQALQKRGLPRSLMNDNGSAMTAAEFVQGLSRLSILHEPTLPYSPYQNAKQEVFWAQVEGRLMAMLEGEPELTLDVLNEATIAWVEFEYHRKIHSEINTTPLTRYLKDKNVGRNCPNSQSLREAFCMQVTRRQRRSDGTCSLEGKRFEVPACYRHMENLCIRYARWDLSKALLVDPHSDKIITKLYPQDKSNNSHGMRRVIGSTSKIETNTPRPPAGIAPLLKKLMTEYAATGLPPAYVPKRESTDE